MIEFAWIALFSWPLVTVALFRSLSLPLALISALFGGISAAAKRPFS